MNHSQKSTTRKRTGILHITAKLVFIIAAAALFCSGICRVPESTSEGDITQESLPAEIVSASPSEAENTFSEDTDSSVFIRPLDGVLTSAFGQRGSRRHTGIDIGADSGSRILAARDGNVSFSGVLDGYGNYIILDHGNGVQTAYGHCSKLLVSKGDSVNQGDTIALVGSTGNSTGPHLHFEVKIDDEFINPLDYVMY